MNVFSNLQQSISKKKKLLAVLIDPDKQEETGFASFCQQLDRYADFLLFGGSFITHDKLNLLLTIAKKHCKLPLIIFPGNGLQVDKSADALWLLSLLSGRNAEYLIGQQVVAAPRIKAAKLEVIPTAYLLIDGESRSSVEYVSQTQPIPHLKNELAVATALAGEMLGFKQIYLEAGSGAKQRVPDEMIREVKKNINIPLIVGGGIRKPEEAIAAAHAGADIIVVGNILETNPELLIAFSEALETLNG